MNPVMRMVHARMHGFSPVLLRLFTFTFVVGMITSLPDILFNFYLLSMGFDNAVVGSLASLLRLSGFIVGIPVGIAVDRFGGVRTVQVAAVFNMLVWAVLLNTSDVALIRVLYFLSGIFFTAQAISILPMISRVSTLAQRPQLFGINFSLLMATGIVSALIGGRLPQWLAGWLHVEAVSTTAYRAALYAVIVLCVGVLLVLWGLNQHIDTHTHESESSTPSHDDGRVPLWQIVWRSFGRALLGFAGGIFFPFINIFLRQQYALPDATVGTIIAIYGVGSALGGLFVSRVMHRVGVRGGMIVATLIAGGASLCVLIPYPWVFVVVYTVFTFVVSLIFPLADVLLMGMVAPSQRGVANSVSNMLWSLGWAVAAWLSGMLQVQSGFFWPIVLAAGAFVLVGVWFGVVPFPIYAPLPRATQEQVP